MSTAKRARRRPSEARAVSPEPSSKRLKTTKDSHVPNHKPNGISFLVDEDARTGKKLEAKLTNGVSSSKSTRVDESHAAVAAAPNSGDQVSLQLLGSTQEAAIGISSGEESSSSDEESSEDEDEHVVPFGNGRAVGAVKALTNGHAESDGEQDDDMEDGQALAGAGAGEVEIAEAETEEAQEEPEEEREEPSFGDMLQARHPETINVHDSFPDLVSDRQALVPASGPRQLAPPSGLSLGTVLTQALRTNDRDLLESCLRTNDKPTIQTTVERLPSQHAANLLERIAERMHKRPGRVGKLMGWIQAILVTHGGYLSSRPDVMKDLKSLKQVIHERASGLMPLMMLKGKLDILREQLSLRQRMMQAQRAAHADDEEDDDDIGVVYVEGRDDDEWSEDDVEMQQIAGADSRDLEARISEPKSQTKATKTKSSSPDGDDDDMPNRVIQEGDDDSADEEEDEEEEGLFDDEAEETSDDDGEDEEEYSEEEADSESDEELEDDSDHDGVKAPRPQTLSRKR